MEKRFVAIWLRFLKTDWYCRRIPAFKETAFALSIPDHGRKIIAAANPIALQKGIYPGAAVADARAIHPQLHVLDDKPGHAETILQGLAEWFIRYTPWVAIDMPDGLLLDATGCAHLWGGEKAYITEIYNRLSGFGYYSRIAVADSIGAAWAVSRFGENISIVENGGNLAALLPLPPAALRLEAGIVERLHALGLKRIEDFISMPAPALRRRFGKNILTRISQALGHSHEIIIPVQPVEPYQERLPCLEPVLTRTGIEMALEQLLQMLCSRLKSEGKGLRNCTFKCFRTDGKIQSITIGTNRATANTTHLFRLFEIKLDTIEPALGIELFLLETDKVQDTAPFQEKLWEGKGGVNNTAVVELLDRLTGKFGDGCIQRFLPDEHHWPERSIKPATSLEEVAAIEWKEDQKRPVRLLKAPEPVQVTAPIPDYPPMNFRYKGKLHKVIKADGPERIEQEWWLQQGEHRDYYSIEDEDGRRYSLFRSGHYDAERSGGWYLHGFFA